VTNIIAFSVILMHSKYYKTLM